MTHWKTKLARAGGAIDPKTGGVVPPLQPSTTFVRDENYELLIAGNSYGRDQNPSVQLAEQLLCDLEGATASLLFSSGMAAISALVSGLKRGDTLILQSGIYWGTTAWVRRFCQEREVRLLEEDAGNMDTFLKVVHDAEPRLVFVETPSNPWILSCDIQAISATCKACGAALAVDSTAASPVLTRPLDHGADFVIHSATKVLNGHSDVLAGVLCAARQEDDLFVRAARERSQTGALLGSFEAWLLIRSLRTLDVRMSRMCENAMELARWLEDQTSVEAVWYPGLASHRGHEIAKRQMHGGFGYLLSFLVKGDKENALAFMSRLEGIHRATSLGSVESLAEHRHTIEGDLTGCPPNLIRLSVGIEAVEDLKAELSKAFGAI